MTSALSVESGIKIEPGEAWSYNTAKKVLHYVEDDLKQYAPVTAKGLLLHEIGHVLFTDDKLDSHKLTKKYPKQAHEIQNLAEDIRLTHKMGEKFGNFATDCLYIMAFDIFTEQLTKNGQNWPKLSKLDQFLYLFFTLFFYRADGDLFYGHYNTMKNLTNREVLAKYDKNYGTLRIILDEIIYSKDSNELQKILIDKLYPIIQDWLEENPKTPPFGMPCDRTDPKQKNKIFGGKGIASPITKPGGNGYDVKGMSEAEAQAILSPVSSTIAHRISNILKEKRITRFSGNFKRGKLLPKNVYKVITGDRRPFTKKVNANVPDYEFWSLLDASGSMIQSKMNPSPHIATYASAILIQDIAKKLNFKHYSYSFGDIVEENHSIQETYLDDYCRRGTGTQDKYAMQYVLDDAKKRTNPQDKILFMFTDGLSGADLKPEIEALEKLRFLILAISVGVKDKKANELIKKRFENSIIVSDPGKLPDALLTKLRSIIKR